MIGRDILGIEDLSRSDIELILETAEHMQEIGRREVKKVPTLRGRTLINLFFEPSTRTQTSPRGLPTAIARGWTRARTKAC